MIALPLLLVACSGDPAAPSTDTGPDADVAFDDPLAPDAQHLLVTSLVYGDGHAIEELRPDLSPVWTYDTDPGSGAQGAARLADGSTVFAFTRAPPQYDSSFRLIDASGDLRWMYDDLMAIGFTHGVQPTPAGDFVGLDTIGGAILSFDSEGTLLWSVSVSDETGDYHPNGLSIRDFGDGDVRMAVTLLERSGGLPDQVSYWALGARDEAPTKLWEVPVSGVTGDGAWPHGPHVLADGTVTACHSAEGQVVAYDPDGTELWRVPAAGDPPLFGFPRDGVFLDDGSLVVADAGAEVVRVADPRDDPRVVAAVPAPGVFNLSVLDCGAGGGLPCLSAGR